MSKKIHRFNIREAAEYTTTPNIRIFTPIISRATSTLVNAMNQILVWFLFLLICNLTVAHSTVSQLVITGFRPIRIIVVTSIIRFLRGRMRKAVVIRVLIALIASIPKKITIVVIKFILSILLLWPMTIVPQAKVIKLDSHCDKVSRVLDPRHVSERFDTAQQEKVWTVNPEAINKDTADQIQGLQIGRPNLPALYETILELKLFQSGAPRTELLEVGVIQPEIDKLHNLEAHAHVCGVARHEAQVLRRGVLGVMHPGELDLHGAVTDGIGDPGFGIAVAGRVTPAEAERVQKLERGPAEQEVLDELGEYLRSQLAAVLAAGAAAAGLADVEAHRGGPQAVPPLGEQAGAHRIPRPEVAQDPDEDAVLEAVEAAAPDAGRALPCRVLRRHFLEQVTYTGTTGGVSTGKSRIGRLNQERRSVETEWHPRPRRRFRKRISHGLGMERRGELTER